jgi:hypothetical protein
MNSTKGQNYEQYEEYKLWTVRTMKIPYISTEGKMV